mmetsp:Transcript_30224/g.84442  ORF Transcript_30224/g.84442 Transcript_30224/m.84442 type:complete len:672 (+) Transcript_30224:641-2656(+)
MAFNDGLLLGGPSDDAPLARRRRRRRARLPWGSAPSPPSGPLRLHLDDLHEVLGQVPPRELPAHLLQDVVRRGDVLRGEEQELHVPVVPREGQQRLQRDGAAHGVHEHVELVRGPERGLAQAPESEGERQGGEGPLPARQGFHVAYFAPPFGRVVHAHVQRELGRLVVELAAPGVALLCHVLVEGEAHLLLQISEGRVVLAVPVLVGAVELEVRRLDLFDLGAPELHLCPQLLRLRLELLHGAARVLLGDFDVLRRLPQRLLQHLHALRFPHLGRGAHALELVLAADLRRLSGHLPAAHLLLRTLLRERLQLGLERLLLGLVVRKALLGLVYALCDAPHLRLVLLGRGLQRFELRHLLVQSRLEQLLLPPGLLQGGSRAQLPGRQVDVLCVQSVELGFEPLARGLLQEHVLLRQSLLDRVVHLGPPALQLLLLPVAGVQLPLGLRHGLGGVPELALRGLQAAPQGRYLLPEAGLDPRVVLDEAGGPHPPHVPHILRGPFPVQVPHLQRVGLHVGPGREDVLLRLLVGLEQELGLHFLRVDEEIQHQVLNLWAGAAQDVEDARHAAGPAAPVRVQRLLEIGRHHGEPLRPRLSQQVSQQALVVRAAHQPGALGTPDGALDHRRPFVVLQGEVQPYWPHRLHFELLQVPANQVFRLGHPLPEKPCRAVLAGIL